ncbi:fructose-bisphosphate aldolase/6-deoxy-5-ketofructose 1-phosphate synthase [Methanocalculus alkaliphilus]|uniref:aldolase n=1 Tax=Methanocalculus alkaliphilus TaxID=768730 RepID=UPI00209EE3BC|nr:aldolase [Methanocalculus alkaliphilus]MCP1714606.1 fructose-bisphosphate aldolase/6-deoxy-5-ketofructose 1-phosphate synthase [Methanocalculus alkaliphilus]
MSSEELFSIPLDVPYAACDTFIANYQRITRGTGRLMLFAGDQKVEHLNDDFYGEDIHPDDCDPIHLFRVAAEGKVGVFATQFGLIARYGMDFADVPYLVKLNSKTHLVKTGQRDPVSPLLVSVQDVVDLRDRTGLAITSVGYTIYIGSEFEADMLREAQQVILDAHRNGLLVVLWIYPRGAAVKDEKDPHLIAGAAGVAAALGADYVKVNAPKKEGSTPAELLKEAVLAAGRTRVVCAGGSSTDERKFLSELYDQIHTGGAGGNATGRNIHQKGHDAAVRFCNAIFAITVEGADVETAWKIYTGE